MRLDLQLIFPGNNGEKCAVWYFSNFDVRYNAFKNRKIYRYLTSNMAYYKIRPDLLLSKLAYSDVTMHVESHCSNHKLDEVGRAYAKNPGRNRPFFYGFLGYFFQDFRSQTKLRGSEKVGLWYIYVSFYGKTPTCNNIFFSKIRGQKNREVGIF